jgi:hypothetical protein
MIKLVPGLYPDLNVAGHYKIIVKIYSSGFAVRDCCAAMEFHEAEIAALNEAVWTGSLKSEIGIEVGKR